MWLHLWIPSWKVEDCRDGCWESSVSSLRSKLFFCCLLNGSVDGTHFFLGQSPLHVTVRDTVTVAHSLCSRRVWKEKKIIWQQSYYPQNWSPKKFLKSLLKSYNHSSPHSFVWWTTLISLIHEPVIQISFMNCTIYWKDLTQIINSFQLFGSRVELTGLVFCLQQL